MTARRRITLAESLIAQLAHFEDEASVEQVLRTYLALHSRKLVGMHWLWAAIERIAAGQPADKVLRAYGYCPVPTAPSQPAPTQAHTLLLEAAAAIGARAALRDCPSGERSMARTVAAFNALFGTQLTETQGWHFMEVLKLARASAGGHHLDDHTDRAAYAALAGESAEREAAQR